MKYTWSKESWDYVLRFFNEKRADLKWANEGLDERFGFAEESEALDTSPSSYYYSE